MYLYFEHSDGSLSLVCECIKDDVGQRITEFVHSANSDYKIYYIRSWGNEEAGYTYDVGSWSEFFHLYKDQLSEN